MTDQRVAENLPTKNRRAYRVAVAVIATTIATQFGLKAGFTAAVSAAPPSDEKGHDGPEGMIVAKFGYCDNERTYSERDDCARAA